MPLNETQKKYINHFGSNLTYEELAKRVQANYDTVRYYCNRQSIDTKSAKLVSTITESDIEIIRENLGKFTKRKIMDMCQANDNVISKWATKNKIQWKNIKGVLSEDEKLFVINNIGLKTNEITKALKAKNPNINYDVVYNFHSKQKDLNNAKEQKAIEHETFEIKRFRSKEEFVIGGFYPYPRKMEFLQA